MDKFHVNDLQTGDLLLFHSKNCISKMIQCCTCSQFNHVGIILRDPFFINKKLKGLYLLHSSVKYYIDALELQKKSGVQITHIDEILAKNKNSIIYVRKMFFNLPVDLNKLNKIYNDIKDKPYNTNFIDWILADFNILRKPKGDTEKHFWCSALVGYVYNKMGLLEDPDVWTLLTPEDWSGNCSLIKTKNCHLGKYRKLNY